MPHFWGEGFNIFPHFFLSFPKPCKMVWSAGVGDPPISQLGSGKPAGCQESSISEGPRGVSTANPPFECNVMLAHPHRKAVPAEMLDCAHRLELLQAEEPGLRRLVRRVREHLLLPRQNCPAGPTHLSGQTSPRDPPPRLANSACGRPCGWSAAATPTTTTTPSPTPATPCPCAHDDDRQGILQRGTLVPFLDVFSSSKEIGLFFRILGPSEIFTAEFWSSFIA